jgi:glycosyltransferase involved in cell wall biosynthesis
MHDQSITPDEERIFIEQMLCVEGLYEHIARQADGYLLFFIPYMFATTYYGVQVRPDRSYLIPCFHDEAYARLEIYRRAFRSVKGMLFLSVPERKLAERMYDLRGIDYEVIGAGVDTDRAGDAERFRRKFGIDGPFVLFAGRREISKNIELLVDYFRQYRQARKNVQLVFIGPGAMPVPIDDADGVIDLGFVDLQDKWDAYAAATVLCQPSKKESFSIVLMESWLVNTPVLVHAAGAVTADHTRRANGGLCFRNYVEFVTCLDVLIARPDLRTRLGQQGREYVIKNFSWDVIVEKYRQLLAKEEGL